MGLQLDRAFISQITSSNPPDTSPRNCWAHSNLGLGVNCYITLTPSKPYIADLKINIPLKGGGGGRGGGRGQTTKRCNNFLNCHNFSPSLCAGNVSAIFLLILSNDMLPLYRHIFLEDTCINIKVTKRNLYAYSSTVISHACMDNKTS